MVGIVVVAHGRLAYELMDTLAFITGGKESVTPVAVDHNMDVAAARALVKDAIREADEGSGVLVLTDLYGGTPSNLAITFQKEFRMEILSGVNLPILIKAVQLQKTMDIATMARKLRDYGKENVILASDMLSSGKGADEKS